MYHLAADVAIAGSGIKSNALVRMAFGADLITWAGG